MFAQYYLSLESLFITLYHRRLKRLASTLVHKFYEPFRCAISLTLSLYHLWFTSAKPFAGADTIYLSLIYSSHIALYEVVLLLLTSYVIWFDLLCCIYIRITSHYFLLYLYPVINSFIDVSYTLAIYLYQIAIEQLIINAQNYHNSIYEISFNRLVSSSKT